MNSGLFRNVKLSDTGIYMCYDKKENKTLQMSPYDRYGQRVQSTNDWKYERRTNVSFDVRKCLLTMSKEILSIEDN